MGLNKNSHQHETYKQSLHAVDEQAKANELNGFHKRFDNYDFSAEYDMVLDARLDIDPKSVNKVPKQININKATGPDGIFAFLSRTCADELAPTWCPIFQGSLDCHTVPSQWKKAIITPIPKKTLSSRE